MQTDLIIKKRRTEKILANEPWDPILTYGEQDKLIAELLELASHAPYHHQCSSTFRHENRELTSSLPFRFYTLNTQECRNLSALISDEQINAGKVNHMLNAADILFLVTWLPDPKPDTEPISDNRKAEIPFEGNQKNMEHIAAASSAIQNVLLGATARDISSYWSSGGVLRKNPLRDILGISNDEILLGALFLFTQHPQRRDAKIMEGHLRNEGKDIKTWSKSIKVPFN